MFIAIGFLQQLASLQLHASENQEELDHQRKQVIREELTFFFHILLIEYGAAKWTVEENGVVSVE